MRDRTRLGEDLAEQHRQGALLRAHRERSGLLQRELADRLGVHFTNIAKWESGEFRIPRRRLGSIEQALKFSFDLPPTPRLTEVHAALMERSCVYDWWVIQTRLLHKDGLTLTESETVRHATVIAVATAMQSLGCDINQCPDAAINTALSTSLRLVQRLRKAQAALDRGPVA